MIVIAIIGILSATAMPFYQTWEKRAVQNEARLMARSILEAEVLYFVYGEDFYPESGASYFPTVDIYNTDDQDDAKVKDAMSKLNISIPTGHKIDYFITNDVANNKCEVRIVSGFGPDTITFIGWATKDGEIKLFD
jgi:type II secretory pathway pseudopilin PulG